MSLYKRGGVWWIDLVHRGARIRRSTSATEKTEAQRQHDELKARLWRQRVVSRHTWEDACREWLLEAPRDDADKYRLRAITYADRPLSEVTSASLQAALTGKSASTYNRYRSLVLAILNLAKARGWIDSVPRIPIRKAPPGRLRWLTAEEWCALCKSLPLHLKAPAAFAVATGWRQSNVTYLEWRRVDLVRHVAWVEAEDAKGKKAIGVPLNEAAMAILQCQLGEHPRWVFPYRGKPLAKIRGAWKRAIKRAGIEPITFHGLRHTWASWHTMNGTDQGSLQELGSWKTPAMVKRYAHLAPEHLRAAAGNAIPVSLGHNSTHSEKKKVA